MCKMILFNIHRLIIMWKDVKDFSNNNNKREEYKRIFFFYVQSFVFLFMSQYTHLPMVYHCQRPHCYAADSRSRYHTLQCYWDRIDGISLNSLHLHLSVFLVDALDLAARIWSNDLADNRVVLESEVLEVMLAIFLWYIDIVAVVACNYYRDDYVRDCQDNIYFDSVVERAIAAAF